MPSQEEIIKIMKNVLKVVIGSAGIADKTSKMRAKSGTAKHYATVNFQILQNFMIVCWFVVPDLDIILEVLSAIPAETITTLVYFSYFL